MPFLLRGAAAAADTTPNGWKTRIGRKKDNICQELSALYTTEFVPNFNSRKISISSWLFSSSFMCHPPAPPPPPPSASAPPAAVTQPEPQTTKTPTDGRGADGRTIQTCGGGTKNLELAGRGRPTLLGSAYYDVKQGSPKLGRVGLDCKS